VTFFTAHSFTPWFKLGQFKKHSNSVVPQRP
jgi:hypothetical protein